MKAKQLTFLDNNVYNSFSIRRDIYPKYHNSWHYHEQVELIMVLKGKGSLYLGDTIKNFSEGTSVLIGSNIPHFWLFHDLPHESTISTIDCIVIHFNIDFAGNSFFQIPELKNLKTLLQQAEKGLIINKENTGNLIKLFTKIHKSEGTARFITLIQILEKIYGTKKENIVSNNYSQLNNTNDELRMRNVMNYIQKNYTTKIELNHLSNEAGMTKNSFCRYFKQKTGKTPVEFINELRIAHACRLLKNTSISLKEICFESGFNNFVSFHKIFKEQLQTTPTHFRKN